MHYLICECGEKHNTRSYEIVCRKCNKYIASNKPKEYEVDLYSLDELLLKYGDGIVRDGWWHLPGGGIITQKFLTYLGRKHTVKHTLRLDGHQITQQMIRG